MTPGIPHTTATTRDTKSDSRESALLVELSAIGKTYGTTRALDRAGLRLHAGRIHAVVGENGAGKSTLLKIAGGVEDKDQGRVTILGEELPPRASGGGPREAIRRGVAMVHQHFMLVPTLTGLENLALGHEPARSLLGLWRGLDLTALRAEIQTLATRLSLSVRLDVPVDALSVGERQRLELLRALRHAPRVLILDEPTAVLAPREAEAVLSLARELAGRGLAVALVTHHLDEVARWADEVTVLRRGAVVAHHPPGDPLVQDASALAREALGEDVPRAKRAPRELDAAPRLRFVAVSAGDDVSGASPVTELSLDLRPGEVVGVAGVEGNGQHALELVLAGMTAPLRGELRIDDVDVSADSVRARRARGVAWIPSDRHAHGIAADLSARDVLRLGALSESAKRGVVDERALDDAFAAAVRDFDVRPDDPTLPSGSFSGGNQQKLVVARELRKRPGGPARVVVAAQPTRGVDLRAAARIRGALLDAAEAGAAVLVLSSDLEELRDLSDRIVVLRSGAIVAELTPDASVQAIGDAMLGGAPPRSARTTDDA